MKVGIVIAVHNGEKYLIEAIESVLNQSYQDWRMVIIDDGSSDRSLELAQAFCKSGKAIEVVHQECCGVSTTRNRGAATLISKGCEVLMFLDQDDVLLPDSFSDLLECLRLNPTSAAAVGCIQPIDVSGEPIPESSWLTRSTTWHIEKYGQDSFHSVSTRELMYACSIATPGCCLVKVQAYSQLNGFDATLEMCEDWDFWLRLSVIGNLRRISNSTIRYRYHDNNTHKSYNARKYALARDKTRMRFLASIDKKSTINLAATEGYIASLVESITFNRQQISASLKNKDVFGAAKGCLRGLALSARMVGLRQRKASQS